MIWKIKQQKEAKYSRLVEVCGVFFSFSASQFEKNKTPLEEGDKYVSIGHGGYMPKSQVEKWKEGTREIQEWFREATKDPDSRRQNIVYELSNHEAYYTGSIDDTLAALGPDYTKEEVQKVYWEEYKNQDL